MYFDCDFSLLYEGEFEDNFKNGSGREYININSGHYDGEFSKNKWHGKGIYFFGNKGRVEGVLNDFYFVNKCKYIYEDAKYSEVLECYDGNVINSHEVLKLDNQIEQKIENDKIPYKEQYSELVSLVESLAKSKDYITLKFDKLDKKNGFYIGEINFSNNPHGRGLFQFRKGKYNLGYWVNGLKEGYCKEYNDHRLVYEGNFRRDKKFGYGCYVISGKKYYGCFNYDGSSNYVVCKAGKNEYLVGEFTHLRYIGKVAHVKNYYASLLFFDNEGNIIKNFFNSERIKIPKQEVGELRDFIDEFKYKNNPNHHFYNKNQEIYINGGRNNQ